MGRFFKITSQLPKLLQASEGSIPKPIDPFPRLDEQASMVTPVAHASQQLLPVGRFGFLCPRALPPLLPGQQPGTSWRAASYVGKGRGVHLLGGAALLHIGLCEAVASW